MAGKASASSEAAHQPGYIKLRRAPPRRLLDLLVEEVEPGGELVTVRRLKGGISSGMHALLVRTAAGGERALVLRRDNDPDVCERHWAALTALAGTAVPAPLAMWRDTEGRLFGSPSLVMTALPGRGGLVERPGESWLRELAEALAGVHRVTAAETGPGVPRSQAGMVARQLEGRPAPVAGLDMDLQRVMSALRSAAPDDIGVPGVLVHGDYWAGNTLWRRGRLTGVVDWEQPKVGDAGEDVGYCRMDLAMMAGEWASDGFLAQYERAAGEPVKDLAFWDLFACTRPLPDPGEWLPGYFDLGLTGLTAEAVRSRLAAFCRGALQRVSQAPAVR